MSTCVMFLDQDNQVTNLTVAPGTRVRYYDSFKGRNSLGLVIGIDRQNMCTVLWATPPQGHKRLDEVHRDDLVPHNIKR